MYYLQLWFAFNYWYYDLWIQLALISAPLYPSCDLLSITGITIFEYNISRLENEIANVVICFQLLVLRSLNTTSLINGNHFPMLWFAFNYWYYDLWIQPETIGCPPIKGCDLLSITGITIFEYNLWYMQIYLQQVVICFQLLVLRSLNTTIRVVGWRLQSCDLLSITGITIFEYKWPTKKSKDCLVVICFQLLVLRSLNTTYFDV